MRIFVITLTLILATIAIPHAYAQVTVEEYRAGIATIEELNEKYYELIDSCAVVLHNVRDTLETIAKEQYPNLSQTDREEIYGHRELTIAIAHHKQELSAARRELPRMSQFFVEVVQEYGDHRVILDSTYTSLEEVVFGLKLLIMLTGDKVDYLRKEGSLQAMYFEARLPMFNPGVFRD